MTKQVDVTITVEVTVDESKFDEDFLRYFREFFYNFYDIDDHIKHLAQLAARGLDDTFIEGYGDITEMGIVLDIIDQCRGFLWVHCQSFYILAYVIGRDRLYEVEAYKDKEEE